MAMEDQFGLGLRPVHRSSSPSLRPLHLNLRCNPRALSRIPGRMTLHSRYTASQLQINSESLKESGLSTPGVLMVTNNSNGSGYPFRGERKRREQARYLLSKTIWVRSEAYRATCLCLR